MGIFGPTKEEIEENDEPLVYVPTDPATLPVPREVADITPEKLIDLLKKQNQMTKGILLEARLKIEKK